MVTLSASLQAPIQAILRPSMWLPCFQFLHSHKEKWKTTASKSDFRTAVLVAIEMVMKSEGNTEDWEVHKEDVEGDFLRIFSFTRSEWLDVIEIKFNNDHYEVRGFSSGLVPLIVPCACLCNIFFCCAPFSDTGLNKTRIQRLRSALTIDVTAE